MASPGKKLPRIWTELPGKRVMVIAPHMDDEVIGCGGTLVRYRQQEIECAVTFVLAERLRPKQRPQEAGAALRELGIHDSFFMDIPVSSTAGSRETLSQLFEIYQVFNFDTLFVPALGDWHPDHRFVNQLTGGFLSEFDPGPLRILGYEVWDHPFPDILVDISSQFEAKKKALACYESQLATFNYQKMIEGMAVMRAAFFRRRTSHAEAFQDYGNAQQFQRMLEMQPKA